MKFFLLSVSYFCDIRKGKDILLILHGLSVHWPYLRNLVKIVDVVQQSCIRPQDVVGAKEANLKWSRMMMEVEEKMKVCERSENENSWRVQNRIVRTVSC